tara:strand:+ start:609 stop:752 length:144 start_codon:yes stop_codon:yes gene_type:complete
MKQYKVFINGHKTVLANSEENAIKGVEETMKSSHYSLNLDIAGVKEQ